MKAPAIISLALVALLGLTGGAEARQAKRFIVIGTGGPTGIYFVVGNSICRMVNKEADRGHGIRCSAPSSGGSTYNIDLISKGELDFGMAQSDWQYHAYNCSSEKVTCFKKLRSVFSVHPEPFQLIVAKDSGINGWDDLKGKRVNIGNPGSGQRGTMEVLMAAHGTKVSDFAQVSELISMEQSTALCKGRIDAYGYTVGVPNAGVAKATNGCGARIIDLDGPVERKLVSENPYYAFATIPKGTYKTTSADVTTFGVVATVVTSADVPEELVYEVTRAVFENLDEFRALHPALAHLDPKRMIRDGLSAPLHPGAIRYYKARGWM